jgi:hypothetical protein
MGVVFLWRAADIGVVFVWRVWDGIRNERWQRGIAHIRREFPALGLYGTPILFSVLVGYAVARLAS